MRSILRILCVVSIILCCACTKQSNHTTDEDAIKKVLNDQAKAWSQGDMKQYMEGYWKSDSLKFIGSRGLTYGWQQTLDNYLKSYPTTAHTGTLKFTLTSLTPLGDAHYHVIGNYHLTRTAGDISGIFSLVMKKIDGAWKIIIDHSC